MTYFTYQPDRRPVWFFSCEHVHSLKIDRIGGDFDKKKKDIYMPQKITCFDTLFQDFLHHSIL